VLNFGQAPNGRPPLVPFLIEEGVRPRKVGAAARTNLPVLSCRLFECCHRSGQSLIAMAATE
jgi:hypothetical protein